MRASPRATAGVVERQRFDPATGRFSMTYRPDPSASAPTAIVLPPQMYPDGYAAGVTGGRVVSEANAGQLLVEADKGASVVDVEVVRT